MTVKTFFIGLIASFALPWLAVVAVPYATMRAVETPQFDEGDDGKVGPYTAYKSGSVASGSAIYGAEGCAQCHSQLARPTYAGSDLGHANLAGLEKDPNRGDTRRESILMDYDQEPFAWIGETRMGPDLSNFGRRMEVLAIEKNEALAKERGVTVADLPVADRFDTELAVYTHLFNPRNDNRKSVCSANKHMFTSKPVHGQRTANALPVTTDNGDQIIPKPKALTLASYLLGLKRDNDVPYAMNNARSKKKASAK